jgi:hypothetical protein
VTRSAVEYLGHILTACDRIAEYITKSSMRWQLG